MNAHELRAAAARCAHDQGWRLVSFTDSHGWWRCLVCDQLRVKRRPS